MVESKAQRTTCPRLTRLGLRRAGISRLRQLEGRQVHAARLRQTQMATGRGRRGANPERAQQMLAEDWRPAPAEDHPSGPSVLLTHNHFAISL